MKNLSEILSLFEYKVLWPATFSLCRIGSKPDGKRILFADPYENDLTENMIPVYAALSAKGGYTLIKCFPKSTDRIPDFSLLPAKIMAAAKKVYVRILRSLSYMRFLREYAKCGTLFITESYLPAYAVRRPHGTNVVQLWHGCGAFKKWGYSTLDKTFGANDRSVAAFPMHNCYTLVPVTSAEVIPHYADAFRTDSGSILPLGVPKTDAYFAAGFSPSAKAALFSAHPELPRNKKLVLYAPTFRGNTVTSAQSGLCIDFISMKKALNNDCILLLRLHPFARKNISIPKEAKDFCFDISDVATCIALGSADLLVSDYSSIVFDYSLLERPIVFFAYDLEKYTKERDFYYPYKEFVPGPVVKTQNELESEIKKELSSFDSSKVTDFRKKFMSACDGKSTERILTYLGLN